MTDAFSEMVELDCVCRLALAVSGQSLFPDGVSETAVLLNTRCLADFLRKLHPRLSLELLLYENEPNNSSDKE